MKKEKKEKKSPYSFIPTGSPYIRKMLEEKEQAKKKMEEVGQLVKGEEGKGEKKMRKFKPTLALDVKASIGLAVLSSLYMTSETGVVAMALQRFIEEHKEEIKNELKMLYGNEIGL